MAFSVFRTVLLLVCVVGLLFLPMSGILLYSDALAGSIQDNIRVSTEKTESTDYHSTDITTFTNTDFVFYVPPPSTKALERPDYWYGYEYRSGQFVMANLSSIEVFSYENGAKITIEWLNATVIDKSRYDQSQKCWILENDYRIYWLEGLKGPLNTKLTIELGEYETWETPLNSWVVKDALRILTGTVRITSDNPISVMHHKLCPIGSKYDDGEDKINYNWDGVYSAYGKKLFTRITRDCWISALEANTNVKVYDLSDRNDEVTLQLDRFEGWAYCGNPIFEQYGFDDDLVLIAADKPVSIVAGLQSDQCMVQIFGKDGKDFQFPCFGKVFIQAPDGATIDLQDKNGNQGSFEGTLRKGETRIFDFNVIYKMRYFSSFEWATLRSNKPIIVYTMANNQWFLENDDAGYLAGEAYILKDKRNTFFYPVRGSPYPADSEFKVPLRSRAFVTVMNLGTNGNEVSVELSELKVPDKQTGAMEPLPYKVRMDPYQSVTIEFSEDSYYYMDMILSDTGFKQDPVWTIRDPDNRFMLDSVPRIAVDRGLRDSIRLNEKNITKGSWLKVGSEGDVLVFVNYDRDTVWAAQGINLIPGLAPPAYRGLPDVLTLVVALAGVAIIFDMVAIAAGLRSLTDIAFKGIGKKGAQPAQKGSHAKA